MARSGFLRFAFNVVGFGVLALLVTAAFQFFGNNSTGSSPAEVVGGSIIVRAADNDGFCDKKMPFKYCATTDDKTLIDFTEFSGGTAIVARTGWKLHLFNLSGDGQSKPPAMVVCSAFKCEVGPGDVAPGDMTTIYVEPTFDPKSPQSEWLVDAKTGEPHFHDIAHARADAPPHQEDPAVDHIEYLTIEADGQNSSTQYACPSKSSAGGKHACTIYIGNRNLRHTISSLFHRMTR